MDSPEEPPTPSLTGEPLLLTLPEAAVLTGLSVKALTRRCERGTLPSELHLGRRIVRRGELERLNLIGGGNPAADGVGDEGGDVVVWRDMYERERDLREQSEQRERELRDDLVAIANASGIRAWKLKRQLRERLSA